MANPKQKDEVTERATVSAEEVRDRLGDYLGRVEYGREEIVITRHGKPSAKLVPIDSAA